MKYLPNLLSIYGRITLMVLGWDTQEISSVIEFVISIHHSILQSISLGQVERLLHDRLSSSRSLLLTFHSQILETKSSGFRRDRSLSQLIVNSIHYYQSLWKLNRDNLPLQEESFFFTRYCHANTSDRRAV